VARRRRGGAARAGETGGAVPSTSARRRVGRGRERARGGERRAARPADGGDERKAATDLEGTGETG